MRPAPLAATLLAASTVFALSSLPAISCDLPLHSGPSAPEPQDGQRHGAPPGPTRSSGDFRADEAGILENHVQLTSARDFYRAGEAYFSPTMDRIIFQAVRQPAPGVEPAEFYAMFVGDVVYDGDRIKSLDNIREISPPGTANTCGWFHPTNEDIVYFGCTVNPPTQSAPPGYDRNTGRYKWMFPPEMRIVQYDLKRSSLEVLIGDAEHYQAEDSVTADCRHMVYCSLESGGGDLFAYNFERGESVPLVTAEGYDGGPFFSPDGRRICYRSDRANNHLLQLYVADLAFDADGNITGIEREYQLTANEQVNWGPYWHPNGRSLVYASSAVGHHNYEVFVIDADPGDLPGSPGPVRYGTRPRRITHASGADVLPVFSPNGRRMLWTCQRADDGKSQVWVADFVLAMD